jgi:hypothetical protein
MNAVLDDRLIDGSTDIRAVLNYTRNTRVKWIRNTYTSRGGFVAPAAAIRHRELLVTHRLSGAQKSFGSLRLRPRQGRLHRRQS